MEKKRSYLWRPLSKTLTVAQFEELYGKQKPHYEFWYGEAVYKSIPNSIHGETQLIVGELLREAGYKAGAEIKLKIETDFQPVPDIVATRGSIERPYPTTAWKS